jgi:hypothetical protein
MYLTYRSNSRRLGHAREERALEVFGGSREDDRLAARAAGQDAGVAMLVLNAWVLWILGQIDLFGA